MDSVNFAHACSSATVSVLFTVLNVAVYLAGFCYAIRGQRTYIATMQHHKEMEEKNQLLPTWRKMVEAFEIKDGTRLPI